MTAFSGRSGADAVMKAHKKICDVNAAYGAKLRVAIDLAASAGLITADDATLAKAALTGADIVCRIFEAVAKNSGFGQTGSV
jgi:formate dehydrogenase assembly factor FdhD